MPIHLPDTHKFHPKNDESVVAIFRNFDRQKRYDFLDITTGVNLGLDTTYWKDGYEIKEPNGKIGLYCPGMLYSHRYTVDEVWALLASRLGDYVFPTSSNWTPEYGHDYDPDKRETCARECCRYKSDTKTQEESNVDNDDCPMCADRQFYWAVTPAVFLSRHSRRWHVHLDCFHHFMPRRQFGMKAIQNVEYI